MSGGALDYGYKELDYLAERINEAICDREHFWTREGRDHAIILALELRKLANRARELEWALSGDTSMEDFVSFCEAGRRA